MHGYLSEDIICSEKRTVFRERSSRKTVSYEEQIMSKDRYPSIFLPQVATIVFIILQIFFATRAIFKIGEYINNSHHLARKYARIFVRGLDENCELRGTDNVQGQISEHIFAPNGDYCLYYIILQIFFATRAIFKIGEYSRIFHSFSRGIFGHVTRLGQSRASEKI